jgi:hypothetical protein
MNRKRIYYATLIFPLIVLATILTIGFIVRGSSFGRNLIETITKNWYHIAGGLSAIIIGIEYFGKNLENQLKTKRRLWIAFKYILKIFGFFFISNIITNTIDKAEYIDGIGDFIYKTTILILMSLPVYLILTSVVSLIIGLIISKSKLGKTNANNGYT